MAETPPTRQTGPDDVEQIKQLKYRYLRTLDTKQWEAFAECFVPGATADYAGLAFADRDELVGYMRENLGPSMVTMHHCHHPEILVEGDTATGRWYLHDQVISAEWKFRLEGAAFYDDRYVRTLDGWRIAHTGYERTFEATYDLTDLPGFKITIGRSD
ncbi:MAG: nuclear transport factor 2 family protein [Nocardioides sp.]